MDAYLVAWKWANSYRTNDGQKAGAKAVVHNTDLCNSLTKEATDFDGLVDVTTLSIKRNPIVMRTYHKSSLFMPSWFSFFHVYVKALNKILEVTSTDSAAYHWKTIFAKHVASR